MLNATIQGMVKPPPIMGEQSASSSQSSPSPAVTLTSQFLQQSLYQCKTIPTSTVAFNNHMNSLSAKPCMKCVRVHSRKTWVLYMLDSEVPMTSLSTARPTSSSSPPFLHQQQQQQQQQQAHQQALQQQQQLQQQKCMFVIQDYINGEVIWKISFRQVAALLFDIDTNNPNSSAKWTSVMRSMGKVLYVDFLDPAPPLTTPAASFTTRHDQSWTTKVMIQTSTRIVLLNCCEGGVFSLSFSSDRRSTPRSMVILGHITDKSLVGGATGSDRPVMPTSNVVTLTDDLVVVGCQDGSIRVYSLEKEKMLRSARSPSGKQHDASIFRLVTADPHNVFLSTPKQVKRLVSVNLRGVAYVWEFVLREGILMDIKFPLCRMEGFATPNSDDLTANSMEHCIVDFDAHRELLLGWVPAVSQQSHGPSKQQWSQPHLLVFDLKETARLKRKKMTVPKQEPCTVTFPSIESNFQTSTLLGAWLHPAFPPDCLLSAVLTPGGDVILQVVHLQKDCRSRSKSIGGTSSSSSSSQQQLQSQQAITAASTSGKAYPWFAFSVPSLIQKDAQTIAMPLIKPTCILTHRRLDTTSLLIGCQGIGLVHVDVAQENQNATLGSLHAHLGNGFGSEWGKSLLSADHSSIAWSPLEIDTKNPCGTIQTSGKNRHIIYTTSSGHFDSKRSVRLSPRFLPSPSGNYLCIFWPDENRYEILHLASSLLKESSSYAAAAAVASGSAVVSFAWVGDDDVFCLLHQTTFPDVSSSGSVSLGNASEGASPTGIKKLRHKLNPIVGGRKNERSSGTSHGTSSTKDTDTASSSVHGTTTTLPPRVEVKILVSVSANAAEMGSIAAATARGLGDLTLRGGNRDPPNRLFGGPVLCVASQEQAMFYTLKPGAEEPRSASHYVSGGPTLPSPDYVEWDDDGKLCAVVTQGLVAVYLSQEPTFVLLGNVQLGDPLERQVCATGLKFVHGVLYCTTRTTVQCIYLGDYKNDGICHLDTFILATAWAGPYCHAKSFSLTPPSLPMTLNHPAILGYQSGSLLVSTVTGAVAIPLDHPLLRIGTLIAAGLPSKAQRWFGSIPPKDHEALAAFLDRRGMDELAVSSLSGLSLETMVDLTMRYGYTDRLLMLLDQYGVDGLRQIDLGRGVSVGILGPEEHDHSLVVCVGAYLLSQGKAGRVQSMSIECLENGATKEAFLLSSLLLAVDPDSAKLTIMTALGEKKEIDDLMLQPEDPVILSNNYPVNSMVRDHIL